MPKKARVFSGEICARLRTVPRPVQARFFAQHLVTDDSGLGLPRTRRCTNGPLMPCAIGAAT